MKTFLRIGVGLFFLCNSAAAAYAEGTTCRYFPLIANNAWFYRANGFADASLVTSHYTEDVNSAETFVLDWFGEEVAAASENFTNDESGLRLHRQRIEVLGITARITYDPPIAILPPGAMPGDSTETSGTVSLYVPRAGTFLLGLEANSHIIWFERVNVPYGSVDALRVQYEFTASGTINGQPIALTEKRTSWYADDLGLVKSTATVDGQNFSLELVDADVMPCPEPSYTISNLAVLALLRTLETRARRGLHRCD